MALPDNYRKQDQILTTDPPKHKNCGNCIYITRNNYCVHWRAEVKRDYVCNAWRANEIQIQK